MTLNSRGAKLVECHEREGGTSFHFHLYCFTVESEINDVWLFLARECTERMLFMGLLYSGGSKGSSSASTKLVFFPEGPALRRFWRHTAAMWPALMTEKTLSILKTARGGLVGATTMLTGFRLIVCRRLGGAARG